MCRRREVRLTLALLVAFTMVAGNVDAATQGSNPTAPTATVGKPMPLDGTWIVLDEFMSEGSFFSGSWSWTSADSVTFSITDLYVVSDRFEVYDNNVLIATTPSVPDWNNIGKSDPFDAPSFATDPKVAIAGGYFSSMKIKLGPGTHEITIRDIHIPPLFSGGPPFGDGTVAFSAEIQETVIPTVSEWGIAVLCLLLLVGAKVYFGRVRAARLA